MVLNISSQLCFSVCSKAFITREGEKKEKKIKYCINATPQFALSPKWKVRVQKKKKKEGWQFLLISSLSVFKSMSSWHIM